MEKGIVTEIERCSTVDGPGIRTVIFLKGCPLNCLWCQNPETISLHPQVIWDSKQCIGCGKCIEACPKSAITLTEGKIVTDRSLCLNCGKCTEVCSSQARRLMGKTMTTDELLAIAMRDKIFYDKTGGGVTVSGGEPTIYSEFLLGFFKKCKEYSIHVALDTSGFVKWKVLKEILKYVDLLLYDLKQIDLGKHISYTGVSLNVILENLRKSDNIGSPIWIRTPVIPGYTDSEENIAGIAKFIANLKHVERYELLLYNPLAEQKYLWLGKEYKLEKLRPSTKKKMQELKKIAESECEKKVAIY